MENGILAEDLDNTKPMKTEIKNEKLDVKSEQAEAQTSDEKKPDPLIELFYSEVCFNIFFFIY